MNSAGNCLLTTQKFSSFAAEAAYYTDYSDSCCCSTSSIKLNINEFTWKSHVVGLTHIVFIIVSYILLWHSSVGCTSSHAAKIVIFLVFELPLQLLFRVNVRTLICILSLCRSVHGLLPLRLYLPHTTPFLQGLHFFALLIIFHLNNHKNTCCLKASAYLSFYYFESIFFVIKRL